MRNKILLVLASSLLLSAGWLGLTGFWALGGLVPLLLISDGLDASRKSFWQMAGWTALTMGLWAVIACWRDRPDNFTLAAAQIALFGGVFMLYHYTGKRAKRAVVNSIFVCGWITAEFAALNSGISLPWLMLGDAFAGDTWAVQWYEYTGAFGGSLWILVTNLTIFQAIRTRSRGWLTGAACSVIGPLLVSIAIFLIRKTSLPTESAFYASYGDYIARACVFTFILGVVYFVAYRIRRKNYLQD